MFLDAAALRKMGPFDAERAETEGRFARLDAQYREELALGGRPAEKKPAEPDWKAALAYLGGVLQAMDDMSPESAPANRAAWTVVAPAVQAFYEGKMRTKENEEPTE